MKRRKKKIQIQVKYLNSCLDGQEERGNLNTKCKETTSIETRDEEVDIGI